MGVSDTQSQTNNSNIRDKTKGWTEDDMRQFHINT